MFSMFVMLTSPEVVQPFMPEEKSSLKVKARTSFINRTFRKIVKTKVKITDIGKTLTADLITSSR
jgi:hypothetical protein